MTELGEYLLHVAPVVFVMGVGIMELWKKNNKLIDKIHDRDLLNLSTLEQILAALQKLEEKGDFHFDELRKHISERIDILRKDI